MVVIQRLESRIVTKNDSAEDLLLIPLSDTESLDEVYTPPPPIINPRSRNGVLLTLSTTPCTRAGGRRKRRQFENLVDLLSRGPIEVHIPTIEDFFPCSQRSLISLLEESSFYEAFIYGCEDLFDRLEGKKSVHRNDNHRKLKFDKGSSSSALCISTDNYEKKALARVDESVRLAVVNGSIPQAFEKGDTILLKL
ncbi:hypothetical protein J437_LFUL013514 [Ladona fulva]|uniref:Uncharacterized protein n=1 Tax=Ladona fulva TaxID=123851 RepID=A0A8K0KDQ2_LADFU|nr:hypothetical protein J437_LFUL013514 [Ladona fulva]